MIPGRQVLASIDQSVNEARRKIDELEDRIESITAQIGAKQQAMTGEYRELARVRLDRLQDEEIPRYLDETEQQAAALFGQRDEALSALQREIRSASDHLESLTKDRAAQASRVDEAAKVVDDLEAETQARLDTDPAYRAQRDKAEDAHRKALHAEEKASLSEGEKEQKGEAYRLDPLFMYLWQRDYGLPAYEANGLVRWLDGKVARLIGFADARANFSRLNEIPLRLREHAEGIRDLAESEFKALKKLDVAAREADGILPLERTLEEAQSKLDQIDADIKSSESDYQNLLSQKTAFATGNDEYTQRAVNFLASEFQRDDLQELRRDALSTPFPDDDLVVSKLLDLEQEKSGLEKTVRDFRDAIEQHQARLREVENLRMEFKQQRYDRAGSAFQDDSIIGMVLSQFVQGVLDRGALWKILREQQRYYPRRSNIDFGSGGFGRGTVWNGGIGDILDHLGRGGFGGRRGGGGGFGGFGGGGGGGGFRTGGGF